MSEGHLSQATESNVLEALTDFQFTKYATPKLIRIMYALGVAVILLGTGVFILVALFGPGTGAAEIVFALIAAPLGALLYVIVLRVYAELVSVIFRMAGGIDAIARSLGDGSGATAGRGPTQEGPPPPPTPGGG